MSEYHNVPTLGDLLREAKRETGLGLGDLTVLSAQNDPFRIDTPTFHEAGRWFAAQIERLELYGKHLRACCRMQAALANVEIHSSIPPHIETSF